MIKRKRKNRPTVSICTMCDLEIIGKVTELPNICPGCKKPAEFAFRYINKEELLAILEIETI